MRGRTDALRIVTLDHIRSSGMKKIYCKCGRIVGLDRNIVKTKERLNKKPECPSCRNARISSDIDEINRIFEGADDEDAFC